jgi:DNA-binding NarL/FixJ family response regulator
MLSVPKIRVVLADDHPEMIEKVRRTLGEEFEIIDAVADGNQAIKAVLTLDPDVLVTDISMPIRDGLSASKLIQSNNCRAKIIFLTIHDDPDFVTAAISAGASGYVTKARLTADLAIAIRAALEGHTFISCQKLV